MLQELPDETENQGSGNKQFEANGDDGKPHINICQHHSDREH